MPKRGERLYAHRKRVTLGVECYVLVRNWGITRKKFKFRES